jgi:hypothetical protein
MVVGTAFSQALVASSDSTLTYTLQAGSTLPTGISLSSGGTLSGTPTGYSSTTVFTPVIVATDLEGQATQQTITITVSVAEVQFPYVTTLLKTTGVNSATNSTFLDETAINTVTTNADMYQGSHGPFAVTGWSTFFPTGSDFLTTPTNAAFAFGTGAFTIEFWFFISAAPTPNVQVVGVPSTGGIAIYSTPSSTLSINLNGTGDLITSSYSLASTTVRNQWHHVVGARAASGGAMRMWVDGTSVASGNSGASISAPVGFKIGPALLKARISNLRVTNTDVYGVGNASITVPTAPLTAITGTVLLTCNKNRFVDSSTNNFTLTVSGAPAIIAVSPFAPGVPWSAASHGGSAYFPGSPSYLSVPSNAVFNIGTGDFTVEFWVYSTVNARQDWIDINNGSGYRLLIYYNSTAIAYNTANVDRITGPALTLNTWQHIAVSRVSGSTKMFQNGVQIGSTYADTTNFAAAQPVSIGKDTAGSTYITGYMSGLRIIKGTGLYTTAFSIPTAPPTNVANTSLLMNFTNAGIYDAHATTGNDYETLNVTTSTARTKYALASMLFNGTSAYLTNPASPAQLFGVGDFTVEFWINFTATTGTQAILYWYAGVQDRGGISWNLTAGSLTYYFTPTVGNAIDTAWSPVANTWYHIALVRASAVTKFYIDGVAKTPTYADTRDYSTATGYQLIMGRDPGNTSVYFNGYLEDVRVTNGFARYTANFTPPTTGLVGQ